MRGPHHHHDHDHHHHPPGPPGPFGPGGPRARWAEPGFGEWGGPWRRGGAFRRVRRGDIRPLLLTALLEGPAHGYELIGRLEQRSSGIWRPSPGSVYPTLQLLADEGLVAARDVEGKRVYELTDTGRAEAESRKDEAGPWTGEGMEGQAALGDAFRQLVGAFRQVMKTANTDQLQRSTAAVHQARQTLYQILAER